MFVREYPFLWEDSKVYRQSKQLDVLGLRPPEKSKWSHPYSYDPFIVWFGNARRGDHAVYDDRLYQWDYDKHKTAMDTVRAKDEHQRFRHDNPKQVEEYLSLYYGKKITLTAIVEGCDVSNGYPYWVFYFREEG